jgi:hypothetical protein
MIKHLQVVGDKLIKKFKNDELQLVLDNNIYHSPEESETDLDNDRKKIVVNDLGWRSSTVSNLMLLTIIILICTNYLNFSSYDYFYAIISIN